VRRRTTDRNVSVARYAEVVSSAEIRAIRLINSDFNVEAQAISRDHSKWKLNYGCDVVESRYDASRKLLTALVATSVVCKFGRRNILSHRCKYVVVYDVSGDPEEEAALQFVERVGRFAAYPYFRTLFADMTTQAGVNLPPLPVLKEGSRPIPRQATTPTA
jgi:preprotein translocase subunit SecB